VRVRAIKLKIKNKKFSSIAETARVTIRSVIARYRSAQLSQKSSQRGSTLMKILLPQSLEVIQSFHSNLHL